jgi:hypothetical protein
VVVQLIFPPSLFLPSSQTSPCRKQPTSSQDPQSSAAPQAMGPPLASSAPKPVLQFWSCSLDGMPSPPIPHSQSQPVLHVCSSLLSWDWRGTPLYSQGAPDYPGADFTPCSDILSWAGDTSPHVSVDGLWIWALLSCEHLLGTCFSRHRPQHFTNTKSIAA